MHTKTKILKITSVKKIMMVALAIGIALSYSVSTYANQYQDEINDLQNQINQYQAQAEQLGREANTLQNALNVLTAEKNAIQAQIDLNEQKFSQLQAEIAANETKLERQKATLSKTVAQIYANGSTTPIEMLAGSKNVGEYVAAQGIRNAVRGQMKATMDQVKALKKTLETQKQEVEAILAEQKNNRDVLAAKENEQAQLVAATRSEEAAYQGLVSTLVERRASAEAALARSLNTGSYRSAPVGPISPGATVGFIGNSGLSSGPHLHLEMRKPNRIDPSPYLQGWQAPGYMTQGYGEATYFYGPNGHPGLDYGANEGTPIGAVGGGYLYRGCSDDILGTTNNAYGYVAIVEQGNGVVTIYAHMSGGPAACNYNTYY